MKNMVYKVISGKNLISLLVKKFGYNIVSQKGSHIKLKHLNGNSLIIPNHKMIKEGTFNSILSFVAEDLNKTKSELFKNLFE